MKARRVSPMMVVAVILAVIAAWMVVRSLPHEAERLFVEDLARAEAQPWRAHRALRFDRHRAATDQWMMLARLLDHPDKGVRNRAARVVASIDTPLAFDTMTAAWQRGRFEADDFRSRLRRMDNPMQLREATEFVATGTNADELKLDDWLANMQATHRQFFGDARLNAAFEAFDAALAPGSGS